MHGAGASAMLISKAVLPELTSHLHHARLTRQQVGALAGGVMGAAAMAWWALTRKRADPDAMELVRRTLLADGGRIIDGSIIGIDGTTEDDSEDGSLDLAASGLGGTPRVVMYRYRIAGVTYECAQDVRAIPDRVTHLRIDLPVQVRYDPHNPGDSIVVAEGWTGLQQETIPDADDLMQPPR